MRESHAEISVNLDCVSPVVRERFKNETVATFYDVCDVFGSKNDPFCTFAFRMKVNLCFKAKKEAFRERKSTKVENGPF